MFNYICSNCNSGTVRSVDRQGYQTLIDGVKTTIPLAVIGVCDKCGAEVLSKKEIKKWKLLVEGRMNSGFALLGPTEIKNVREALRLSVAQFARLLGTTRQSVHNWERLDRKASQMRLVDLFIRLIDASRSKGDVDVITFLEDRANQSENAAMGDRSQLPPLVRSEPQRFRLLPPEAYSRNFGESPKEPNLPLLTVH